ncbi:MAG: exo-alpha-sialidase [Phycisphaeraceae bacterium]|nr:exo-alpha-sialidase [Phycisphaeraceae bacterium]
MLQRSTRKPFQIACLALLLATVGAPAIAQAVRPLADDYVVVYESPDAESVYVYSPGITVCPNGRLIATCDLGGKGAGERRKADPTFTRGRAFISDDHGKTWRPSVGFSMWAARPFVVGDSLYILGADGDLKIIRSDDWGDTWSEESQLTDGDVWHQAPCNVWYSNGNVYLVMERNVYDDVKTWTVSVLAPVLMRGKVGDDLLKRESWTFASEVAYRDAVPARDLDYFGVPFFDFDPHTSIWTAPRRNMTPPGWLETNVVQITDPNHYWYDSTGHTFHLFMRAHTGGTGYAALAKVIELPDGSMKTMLETNPSGKKVALLPMPGGQMKFHVLYDEQTKLYWLLSSQATDSMTRSELLPPERFNLPNNERHRLQLHFSKNMVDWCFAGIVAIGGSPKQSRHYASMVIDGDDLHVLSRSGDERSHDAHNGNILTFHTVKNFRDLVY